MQVVINKYFLLNLEKNLAQIRLVVFEKNEKNAPLNPKNDVTEPKAWRLGYSNNQLKAVNRLKHSYRLSKTRGGRVNKKF